MKRTIILLLALAATLAAARAQAPLSLEEYKARVLGYNQNVQIADETFRAAEAAVREARAAHLPRLDGSAAYNYAFNPQSLTLGSFSETLKNQSWQAGGGVTQNIYSGSQVASQVDAAKIRQEIASLEKGLSETNIAYAAESAYWNTAAATAYVGAARRYLDILRELHVVVQDRFDNGYIGKIDLLKVETNLSEAEYQLSRTEQLLDQNLIVLRILMGAEAGAPVALADSIGLSATVSRAATLDDVLAVRPEYQIRSRQIDLQQEQWRIDRSQFLPRLQAGGTLFYGTPQINFTGDTDIWPVVYAQLSIPLFQGDKRRHTRDRNNAQLASATLAQSETADLIRRELETAQNNVDQTRRQIDIARRNLDTAAASLDLHSFSYREGKTSILDLQSAQIAWLQAYSNLITSNLNHHLAIAAYARAVGR